MWNTSVKIPLSCTGDKDSEGFEKENHEYLKNIPANIRDATRQDEIVAGQRGYRADKIITVMACNYNGQMHIIDESDGKKYEVKRAFSPDKGMVVELTAERMESNVI